MIAKEDKDSPLRYEISEPYDPKSISIDTRSFEVATIIRRLGQATIRLAPSFQRNEVWDIIQKCRLIESLILNIPIPMFYVASDEEYNLDVVDGMQRLSAIRDFIFENGDVSRDSNGNGFALTGLEFVTELNGKKFKDLDHFFQNRILESVLTFTIINPGTPEGVKFIIFSRVNTGGLKLTDQEVRHALYNGQSTELLKYISEDPIFIEFVGNNFDKKRMTDREVALQTLAFIIRNPFNFPRRKNFSEFLAETMIIINAMPELKLQRLKKALADDEILKIETRDIDTLIAKFERGLYRAATLFEDHTFRKSMPGHRKTRINKYLVETWICTLQKLGNNEFNTLNSLKEELFNKCIEIYKDKKFNDATSRYALYPEYITMRHQLINNIVTETLRN